MTEHSAIERYIEALETKDFKALGDLFTSDGHYCDYCPNGTSQHEYHLYGKEAITMFFQNKFLFRQYSILSPVILNDRPGRVHCFLWRLLCDGDRKPPAALC